MRIPVACLLLSIALSTTADLAAGQKQRVRLSPQYAPGQVLRYQMEYRTSTEAHRTGLAEDPQAATQLEITWNAVVRIEVLAGDPAQPGSLRLRAAYEKSLATARSDLVDPQGEALAAEYRQLEGRSVECLRLLDGKVSEWKGLEDLGPSKAAAAAREWLSQLAAGVPVPARGIVPGEKWSAERPAEGAPLNGLIWRTESTYLRDEPCRMAEGGPEAASASAPAETCAVILTRLEMKPGASSGDPTPADYRKLGLQTSGQWSGSGESLTYISLSTGFIVSITQTGSEEMDVTVSGPEANTKVRYAGRVRSQSQVMLLPETPK